MKDDQSLIKNNPNRIQKIFHNVVEFIKSKTQKDYILSDNSPEFLKRNPSLILKTISRNVLFLNQVSDDILLEELRQASLPANGIIDTAFKNGYFFSGSSPDILFSEDAKATILAYVKMQEKITQKDNLFRKTPSDTQSKITFLFNNLDETLLQDATFRSQLLDLVNEKGYMLSSSSPIVLKQNPELAESYYANLIENNTTTAISEAENNILNPALLQDKNFLQSYIHLLTQKNIPPETIIQTLTQHKDCILFLKNNLEAFEFIFEQVTPENLEDFFGTFFNDKELETFLTENNHLKGKLLHLSKLYTKDPSILQSLDGRLLEKQYENIPLYKKQIIAKNSDFQDKILGLNEYQYSLYSKMTELVAQKTSRWNRFEQNIVENLSDGYYEELLHDLYEQAKQGNKIDTKDIETLTFLLSKECSSKSFFDEYITNQLESQSMDVKQEEMLYSNNVFNITTKNELKHFEEIKELVCDTVLTNPSLDDKELTSPIHKYLEKFRQLPELDRMKLALLEKYYNMDLREADHIVNKFSTDIDNISVNDAYQASIVEQLKAIKNIFECKDIDILSQIGDLDIFVQTDLSASTYLTEQTKEIFEQAYKENLYMPKKEDKIETITFHGKNIAIYDANTDFAMIVKTIGMKDNNAQEIWNSMTKYKQKDLRYYTCCSYMTDELILNHNSETDVILGFAQGTDKYSFDEIFPHDAHTPFYGGDSIYNDFNSSYMLPPTLEMYTDNNHNEIIINTLGIDEQGQMTKLQPDYVVYIKKQSDIDLENLEDDILWTRTKKVASEFGVPIVVIDKEKIRESERAKISDMSAKLSDNPSSNEILRFIKKVEHYTGRYDVESILEYAPKDKMDFLKKYMEQRQLEEKENISIPKMPTSTIRKQPTDNRQEILKKQAKLKEDDLLIGE